MTSTTTAVILAAGMGTRMRSRMPKALQPLANRPMIQHLIAAAETVFDYIIVVVGPDMPELEKAVSPHKTVIQRERLGTGHAALTAISSVKEGEVVFLYADNPLLTPQTMQRLLKGRHEKGVVLTLLGMRPADPAQYGRLITHEDGSVQRIVEYKDASPSERAIPLCNAGMMCADSASFQRWLSEIRPNNVQGEYYLTDIVEFAAREGRVHCIEADEKELAGVNSRVELARAEATLQERFRLNAMEAGATLIDPASTFLSADTQIDPDVIIEPNVFIGPGVVLKEGCTIRAFSHLERCVVGEEAIIGPYARLRPGTHCESKTRVGNFVELKNTTLGEGSKANHLSYLGDTSIGRDVNIGAGSITCNYDGVFKHKTTIGDRSFIGSNSLMIAPISIGKEALIAAGSILTKEVPARAMAFGRAKQINKEERGLAYQQALRAKKEQG